MAREIVFLVFPDFQILDLTGPLEVFSQAERRTSGTYVLRTLALKPGPVTSSSGLAVHAEAARPFSGADTLIVVGGRGTDAALAEPEYAAWVRDASSRVRRVASVCTGAFFLAEAGLLAGHRATTHWSRAVELAERYPAVAVDADPIFIREGRVSTSAGVTSGIDLALALVEEDLGSAAARRAGFGTLRTLQRSFQRVLSVAPHEYRERFTRTDARAA